MDLINQINFRNNFMRPINPSFIPKGMFYIQKKKNFKMQVIMNTKCKHCSGCNILRYKVVGGIH